MKPAAPCFSWQSSKRAHDPGLGGDWPEPNVFCPWLQVDVCKLMQTFPRGMSACVRESFARMEVMDPLLRSRLSRWLAYHLSNFDFMWPWDKWKHVLTAPAHDAQRCDALAACSPTSGNLVPLRRAQLLWDLSHCNFLLFSCDVEDATRFGSFDSCSWSHVQAGCEPQKCCLAVV